MRRRKTCKMTCPYFTSHHVVAGCVGRKSHAAQVRIQTAGLTRRCRAWTSFAFLFSMFYMSGLFAGVSTFTHYCSACEEAIAVRRPGSRAAQILEQSEIKTHGSQ